MIISRRLKICFILVFVLGLVVFISQNKQVTGDKDKELREKILAVYRAKGEQGLRDFFKKSKKQITNKFIMDFAEAGMIEIEEDRLIICKILAEEREDAKTLAVVLFRTAEYYSTISDYKNAFDYFDKSFPIFVKLKHQVGQGNVYLCKGDIYAQTGEDKKANEMYDLALPFFEEAKDSSGQGNVHLGKGKIYSLSGENSKALEMFDIALSFFEKAKYTNGQGNVYMQKGSTYYYSGDNSKALEMYDKALVFYEKTGFPIGLANVYLRKGVICSDSGDNSKALEMYDKALPFFVKAADSIGQGNVYLCKGDVYLLIGDNSKALEMYDKTLPFFEKAADPIGLGNVYMRKGDIYFNTGNNFNGIMMYDQALSFYEKSGDIVGQGNVYKSKGNIYLRIGDKSKAIELFDKALSFFEKAGNIVGQGNVYHSKGEIYSYMENNSKALEMYDKAQSIFENTKNIIGQGNVYISKGYIYFTAGKNSKALDMYNKALLFFAEAEEPIGQGIVYYRKGEIYFKIGDNSKAIEQYDKSFFFFNKAGDIELESFSLNDKAKCLMNLREKDKAMRLFEKGIANLETIRTQTAFSEMKKVLMKSNYNQYEKTVLFMLENKSYEKGFKYAESMRARVFLDQMAEGLVPLDKGLKSELKEERESLVGKLSALSRQMQETPFKEEKKLQELKEEYHRVESQFDDLLIKIRLENPLYASVNYPQPVSVRDLQTDVLKKGESLLSFFIAPDKAYAFIVSKESFQVKPLPVNEKEIDGYVQRCLLAIKENHTNEMNRLGSLLYEKLFQPLEKYLKKSREIIIVPSGPLETIPFESLIVSKKNPERPVYLLEKYRLKYVQGASLLSILRKHYNNTFNTGDSTAKSFIGFGDPVYDYENFKQGKPEQGTMKIFATKTQRHKEILMFSREDTRSDTEKKVEEEEPAEEITNNKLQITNKPQITNYKSQEKPHPSGTLLTPPAKKTETQDNASLDQSPITNHQSPLTNSPADEIKEIHRDRYARAGGIMDRLPYSGTEIQSIAQLFEKESLKTVIYLREQATEDNARAANMKDFDYIHFSCHGLLNDDFQSLVLSQLPAEKSREDGYFTLNEIMNCDYNAQLVVLSACETGSGKMYKGEGVTGLTRAVMYAGTPAVVASLWKVDDIATKELMVRFYKKMLENKMDKVEALRQAKLELLKNQNYRSPLYWSSFVMYGE